MRLRDLPTELEKRGNHNIKDLHWSPDGKYPDIWVGIIYALYDQGWITPDETLSFCLELEAAGVSDSAWLDSLKEKAYKHKQENKPYYIW